MFRISLDYQEFDKKPQNKTIGAISKRLSEQECIVSVQELAEAVGAHGRTFCPATFGGETRKQENVKGMQLFCMDFDHGPNYQEIKEKCDRLGLPILFSYHTFSSTEENPRFRVILAHIVPIRVKWVIDVILNLLKNLFPEADKSCFEASRMFFGGKELIEINPDNRFQLDELAAHFCEELYCRDPRNYQRNLKIFAQKCSLGIKNNRLDICTVKSDTNPIEAQFEEKTGNSIVIIMEIPKNASKICLIKNINGSSVNKLVSNSSVHPTYKKLEKIGQDKICCRCRLCKAFFAGKELTHNQKFFLATNLRFINGYKKKFFEIIKTHETAEVYDRWRYQWIKIDDEYSYNPQSCSAEICPYYKTCHPDKNIILTVKGRKKIIRLKEDCLVSADEAFRLMKEALEKAVKSNKNAIHLIKAQTGIGKTTAYLEILKTYSSPAIIAVPTVSLKNEIAQKMDGDVINSISLEDLLLPSEIKSEINELYQEGFYKEAREVIRRYADSEPGEMAERLCKQYLTFNERLKEKKKHVIMTHRQLLNLSEETASGYTIIVDEDILLTILKNSIQVDVDMVQAALEAGLIKGTKARELKQVIDDKAGLYLRSTVYEQHGVYIKKQTLADYNISGNINDLFRAGAFYKEKGVLYAYLPEKLPYQKIIVLSATLDEKVYRRYFSDREIIPYEVPAAKYQGRLVQYSCYSLSRKNMAELKDNGWSQENLFKRLQELSGDLKYGITFKDVEDGLSRFLNLSTLHFGCTSGTDQYKGEDGIIIGTPHQKETSYKLAGCYLGLNVNAKENRIQNQKVEYGGYEFLMMSYDDEDLRRIQLYMISSELEQSIGRSRLLREDATVYLFSNFPCMQAELHQEDYLKQENEEGEEKYSTDKCNYRYYDS